MLNSNYGSILHRFLHKCHRKLAPYGTAGRGKIRLPKVEHPKFEGHMMPNEEKYKKSVQLKFRYCLGVP